ncbi:MAG: hypothetical protein NUV56_01570, partial [Candidatus Uhrbacteria bacterium]|nr:hypothetical protein [Candidatus Uhrbacteria bacterium]
MKNKNVLSKEVKTKLTHKHVLLDANFFIEAVASLDLFRPIVSELQDISCKAVSFPLIEFEVLRTSHQKEMREAKKRNLAIWNYVPLPLRPSLFSSALEFANYYSAHSTSPSLTDCFIGALLKEHRDLFLITRNHKDFPPPLFIREGSFLIE